MSFWKREGVRHGRSPEAKPELVSEESALAEELEQRDREERGWDRGGRLAAARSALRIGMTTEDVSEIYGSEIAEEASSAEGVQLRSVLLVEDSPVVGNTVADAMRARGLTVHVCKSAEQALKLLQGVDVVLTDLELPRLSGLELIARMRVLRPGLRIVSMRGTSIARERARAAGASHCLVVDDFTNANVAATIERIRR